MHTVCIFIFISGVLFAMIQLAVILFLTGIQLEPAQSAWSLALRLAWSHDQIKSIVFPSDNNTIPDYVLQHIRNNVAASLHSLEPKCGGRNWIE